MTPIPTLSIAARMLLSDQSSAWMRAADAARDAGRLAESDALYDASEAVDELLDNLADAPLPEDAGIPITAESRSARVAPPDAREPVGREV